MCSHMQSQQSGLKCPASIVHGCAGDGYRDGCNEKVNEFQHEKRVRTWCLTAWMCEEVRA